MLVLLLLSLLCIWTQSNSNLNIEKKITNFIIEPTKLNGFLHRAALMALLRAKAKNLLKKLPYMEAIVYRECARTANTVATLAGCVVNLIRTRRQQYDHNIMNTTENTNNKNFFLKIQQLFLQCLPKKEVLPNASNKTHNYLVQKKKPFRPNNRPSPLAAKELSSFQYRQKRFLQNNGLRKRWKYVEMFLNLQDYLKKAAYCNQYMNHINEHNNKYFKDLNVPFQLKTEPDSFKKNIFVEEAEKLIKTHFLVDSVSILSPRIFSLYPPKSSNSSNVNASLKALLSPSLLSFNENDGYLTLPMLFNLISNNNNEVLEWLELLMEISGAGQSIEKLLTKLQPKMLDIENHLLPIIKKAQQLEDNYLAVQSLHTAEQLASLHQNGYAMLTHQQQTLIYGNPHTKSVSGEEYLEELIFKIASIWRNSRHRRQVDIKGPEDIDPDDVGFIYVLQPWAFANRVGLGVILEGLIMSPHAFVTEILAPELLTADVLSPRAFIPTILTPQVLITRILSPSAFRAEVLSPEFLSIYTLTPEGMLAEVLAPKFLAPRFLSPESMTIQVLSPTFLAPRFQSPESFGVLVLSPNVLSPRYNSTEKFMVEILSPHILGGEHEDEEKIEGRIEENKLRK